MKPMRIFVRFLRKHLFENLIFVLTAAGLLSGCVSNVQIPVIEQFQAISGNQAEIIDPGDNSQLLLANLYQLLKANEGIEVPLCTAERDLRRCIKNGVSVFVWGGTIPGIGTRSCYVFSDISLEEHELVFFKDNRKTRFIGTPMLTKGNKCRAFIGDGGLQVQMDRYYANWAGVGNMTMAEGWAIDYLDFDNGIVGLQLELDVRGFFVAGGGSNYVLLKFPNIPDTMNQKEIRFEIPNGK